MKSLTLVQLREATSVLTDANKGESTDAIRKLMDAEVYMVNFDGSWSKHPAPQDPRDILVELGYQW